MSYQAETISTIVKRLNERFFLPAIQREFVWQPDQIIQLFDSLMRNYPISTFLFWELSDENRDKWEIYKFIDNFNQAASHNALANANGVQQLTLVLDGQQRLTSLLIGLKGSYTLKVKHKRWDNPNAFVKQKLFIDLLKDPKLDDETDEIGVRYGFHFHAQKPSGKSEHYWFEVGKVLDFDSQTKFDAFLDSAVDELPDTTTKAQIRVFKRNLEQLYRVIWKEQVVSYYTEHDQNYDRVLDIFVRANEGGTKLSKSDLLLSMITMKWGGMNAREEIYGCVERLNNQLTRKNNFDKDFIMKTCLVVTDLPVQYKVDNFNNQNLNTIQGEWAGIKKAIETGVDLVNNFGIDRDTLTSANALIPIIYYLNRNPSVTLRGTSHFDVLNASRVRCWLTIALLNNVFGGQSDNMLRDTRRVLQESLVQSKDFPVAALSAAVSKAGKSTQFDDFTVQNFLGVTYGKQATFLALSLLYDDNSWGTVTHHQDHIFPRSLFTAATFDSLGIDADTRWRYLELRDSIGNLQLLTAKENLEKSNLNTAEWFESRDTSFKNRHLIPSLNDYSFDKFLDFVSERKTLLRGRMKAVLGSSAINE
jgi:uncharacterized protein with ParB-like and HNH nuclease domain